MKHQNCTNCQQGFQKSSKCKTTRCAPCRREYNSRWRADRRAAGLPSSGTGMPREYHQQYAKEYSKRAYVKEVRRIAAKARLNNPNERHKHEARWAVNHAIAAGRLLRGKCEICGENGHAHHDDYTKPLDVRWFCPAHHAALHTSINATKAEGRAE